MKEWILICTRWCEPCGIMKSIMSELNPSIIDANDLNNHKALNKWQITQVPTIMLLNDGKPIWRGNGIFELEFLKKIYESK